jgi:hypothetical protein
LQKLALIYKNESPLLFVKVKADSEFGIELIDFLGNTSLNLPKAVILEFDGEKIKKYFLD